jgi:hypothetical protein
MANVRKDLLTRHFVQPSTGPPPAGISVLQICFAQLNILLPLSASNQIANSFDDRQALFGSVSIRCIVFISVQNPETITLFRMS